jgi:hypothetical protein
METRDNKNFDQKNWIYFLSCKVLQFFVIKTLDPDADLELDNDLDLH